MFTLNLRQPEPEGAIRPGTRSKRAQRKGKKLPVIASGDLEPTGTTTSHKFTPVKQSMDEQLRPAGPPGACSTPSPAPSLLDLPAALLDDIMSKAAKLGTLNVLLSTSYTLFNRYLLNTPNFRLHLHSKERCERLLTPRIIEALHVRPGGRKLMLLHAHSEAPTGQVVVTSGHEQHMVVLSSVLSKLATKQTSTSTIHSCELSNKGRPPLEVAPPGMSCLDPPVPLDCSPGLAQLLVASFPSLTALTIHGYSASCRDLASLLSHPQLSLQLRQLDLIRSRILPPQQTGPGEETQAKLFQGLRLKQLRLEACMGMPDLQPLAEHLTKLEVHSCPSALEALSQLALLQVLVMPHLQFHQQFVSRLLPAQPRLHTLQLPAFTVEGQPQLDALLAATQLISVQLHSMEGLTSSRAGVPCSWQRLELLGPVSNTTAAYLPLHSLTQPLVLGRLYIGGDDASNPEVAAAVHNLTQACKVPVKILVLHLSLVDSPVPGAVEPGLTHPVGTMATKLLQLHALVKPLQQCCTAKVFVLNRPASCVRTADVVALAPWCQGCTSLELHKGTLTPSLEFWRQLVQLMPTVSQVTLFRLTGAGSAAMYESLRLMAEQPWARWLDITIAFTRVEARSENCLDSIRRNFGDPSMPSKFRVSLR
ncbi:hypothetical protein V8C86DRAFT_93938 [Haematococcus lacustris]